MQYVSPLSFLPTDGAYGPKELTLAKRKLMAEFELTGSTTIPIGGKELSRNDVIKLFDQLQNSGDIEFHVLVASDPVLLQFLEKQEINPGSVITITDEQFTPEFITWISPYFSWSFRKASVKMFRDLNPEGFETLVVMPSLMT